jgi:hypothetical protein
MSIIIPNPPLSQGGYAGVGDEIDIHRRLTIAFIQTAPAVIILTPRARVKQPAGGFAYQSMASRAAQTMRLVEPSGLPILLTGSDGVQRELEMILIGEWNADLERYDIFEYGGRSYEVAQLYFPNGWESRAEVIRFG